MSYNYDTEELVDSNPNKDLGKCRTFLRSRLFRGVLFVVFFSIIIPPLLYYLFLEMPYSDEEPDSTCLVTSSYRVPCGRPNLTENACTSIHCCYDEDAQECYHGFPSEYKYQYDNDSSTLKAVYTALQNNTPVDSQSVQQLTVSVLEIDENRVKIVVHKPNVSYEETTGKLFSFFIDVYCLDFNLDIQGLPKRS